MKSSTKTIGRLLIIASILFVSNPIFAELSGRVKGRVIDKKNHPIELATVTLTNIETQKTTNGAMCDLNGNFTVEDIDQGEYILSVTRIGYKKSESVKIKIDSTNLLVLEKPFLLKDSVQRLPGLVVVAKRKPIVKSTENGLAETKASSTFTANYMSLLSYVSKGYNCVLNSSIQLFDLTSNVKPILNLSKDFIFN